MRILVTGGRKYANADAVNTTLDHYREIDPDLTVIEGGATGADSLARDWANRSGVKLIEEKAKWDDLSHSDALIRVRADGSKYDARAGSRRNFKMLKVHKPDVVIAFPGGNGTRDCVKQARKARSEGKKIEIVVIAA